jgi:hypothetical protein
MSTRHAGPNLPLCFVLRSRRAKYVVSGLFNGLIIRLFWKSLLRVPFFKEYSHGVVHGVVRQNVAEVHLFVAILADTRLNSPLALSISQ